MTDLPPVRKNLTVQETDFRYATAESFAKKTGKSINFVNEKQFSEKSFYGNGTYPATGVNETAFDGLFVFPFDCEIFFVNMFNVIAGSGGTTTLDILRAPVGSSTFTTIFSTKPAIASTAGNFARIFTGGSGTGLTAPVLSANPFLITLGDCVRIDFTGKQTGNAQNCGLNLIFRPR